MPASSKGSSNAPPQPTRVNAAADVANGAPNAQVELSSTQRNSRSDRGLPETTIQPPKLISTRFCCCSIFTWVKAFGFVSLAISLLVFVSCFFALNDKDVYFPLEQGLTLGMSVLGIAVAILLLCNAYISHQAWLYFAFASIYTVLGALVVGFFGYTIYIFAIDIRDCLKRGGSECGPGVKVGLALTAVALTAAAIIQSLFIFVLVKAGLVQKQDPSRELT
ncbi:hypothetical protein AAVH_03521 [Aphelenchoides avenae]|nr:hypothetical protein AAVH_03521 [Aphelenchus avenae]